MKAEQIARARQLIAELGAVLDELESRNNPARAKPRKVIIAMPEKRANPELKDKLRRNLRRQGVML